MSLDSLNLACFLPAPYDPRLNQQPGFPWAVVTEPGESFLPLRAQGAGFLDTMARLCAAAFDHRPVPSSSLKGI